MRDLKKLIKLWHGKGPNLNAGCGHAGTCIVPPFINLDQVKREGWDAKPHCIFELGDVRKLNYPDNTFDVIFASELIEHFYWGEAHVVLKEFYRTLKPGGCLKLICPDFEWAVALYTGKDQYKDYDRGTGLLAKKDDKIHGRMGPIWSVLYGHEGPKKQEADIGHLSVWDKALMKWTLEGKGFINVERVYDKKPWSYPEANARDLVFEAWKK